MSNNVKSNHQEILENIKKQIIKKTTIALKEAGGEVYEYMQEKMEAPKHGNWHIVPDGSGRMYRASAPGEYPAIRLGHLSESLTYKVTPSSDGNKITLEITTDYNRYEVDYDYILYHKMDRLWIPHAIKSKFIKINDIIHKTIKINNNL
jgi:hypothetical protein